MGKVARKYLLPLILGSVFIFAIDTVTADASTRKASLPERNIVQTKSFVNLENDKFWDKFRESVMKDRDKDKNDPDRPPSPPSDSNHERAPHHDTNQSSPY